MIVPKENTENRFARFWIENRILYVRYKPEVLIDLEAARIIVADRITLQNARPFPILCYPDGVFGSTKVARDYLAIKGSVLAEAIAYHTIPTVSVAMLNFFLEKNQPSVRSEIFTNERAAINYLKPFIN